MLALMRSQPELRLLRPRASRSLTLQKVETETGIPNGTRPCFSRLTCAPPSCCHLDADEEAGPKDGVPPLSPHAVQPSLVLELTG